MTELESAQRNWEAEASRSRIEAEEAAAAQQACNNATLQAKTDEISRLKRELETAEADAEILRSDKADCDDAALLDLSSYLWQLTS